MSDDSLTLREAGDLIAAAMRPAPCEHVATITAPIHFTHGHHVGVTDPVTICVTCHATVNLEEIP